MPIARSIDEPIVSASELVRHAPPHDGDHVQHLLVVDDDAIVRRIIVALLHRAGYAVESAADGASALARLGIFHFDLLITDNRMPGMSGVELITRLRAAGSSIAVILASGTLPWTNGGVPAGLRPVRTLAKPFSGDVLLHEVHAALTERVGPSGAG